MPFVLCLEPCRDRQVFHICIETFNSFQIIQISNFDLNNIILKGYNYKISFHYNVFVLQLMRLAMTSKTSIQSFILISLT